MSDRDKFQGLCLVNDEGYLYMHVHDDFPPDVRLRLQSSDFNLCAACISGQLDRHRAIDLMETMLREAQTPGYPNPTAT